MAKFKVKPFKKWLDCLAGVIVKTRDNFQCQIVHDPACAGTMQPLDLNCQCCHIISRSSNNTRWDLLNLITGCGHCHNFAHKNPVEFGVWFAGKYRHRIDWIDCVSRQSKKTWRQSDFEEIERKLLQKAIDLNVDYLHVNTKYRDRFKRRFEEQKGGSE
jgi:hypothetical protein